MISGDLNFCTDNKNVTYDNDTDKCYTQQSDLAEQRHIVKLIRRDENTSLELTCLICPDENSTNFQWFRITRKKYGKTIFTLSDNTFYGSRWILDVNLLEPVVSDVQMNDPCLVNHTNELIYTKFAPMTDSGTYVCRSLHDNDHPSNFIWYHIDYINFYESVSYKLSIPSIHQMNKFATSNYQLTQFQNIVEKEIDLSEDFQDQEFNLLYITSKSFHNLTDHESCGRIKVRQNRVCYIRIPRSLPTNIDNYPEEIQLIYLILLNGFSEFGQFYDDIDQSDLWETFKQTSESQANDLGFKLFMNETYLYIPCQYNFFKQLPNLNGAFQPLKIFNLHITVTYELSCGQSDAMEIVNLALQRDITKMKLKILGFEDVRFMKLEKLAIEHEPLLKLDCHLTEDYKCDNPNNDYPIIWRTSNYTFYLRTILNERIHMNEKCELIIHNVNLNDSDVYSCYTKDTRQPNTWHHQPKISIRLKIEKSHHEWPSKNDLFTGLLFLTIWSIFILIIWFILLIYNLYIIHESKLLIDKHLAYNEYVKNKNSQFSDNTQTFNTIPNETIQIV
ncbi:unnamed protein product [Schistosoma turkestanicum]|nr:unnamed protein product [Schistosoma turkestanicum]